MTRPRAFQSRAMAGIPGVCLWLGVTGVAGQEVRRTASTCEEEAGTAVVYGVVRALGTGPTLPSAFVSVEAGEYARRILTDDRGAFLICTVPVQQPIRVAGHLSGYSSPPVDLELTDLERRRLDLVIDFDGIPAASEERPDRAAVPGSVSGLLVDAGTGEPVTGATLALVSTDWTALSVEDGSFAFGQVLPGPHVLRIDHLAYGTVYWPLVVPPGQLAHVDARLNPEALALEPIVVVATRNPRLVREGFYRRKRWGEAVGVGHFITREDIERWNPTRASTIISQAPGIDIECRGGSRGCHIRSVSSRCSQVVFYLDGIRFTSLGEPLDDFVNPNDIAGIEVYTGLGDLASDFGDMEARRCGAVAVWTRR